MARPGAGAGSNPGDRNAPTAYIRILIAHRFIPGVGRESEGGTGETPFSKERTHDWVTSRQYQAGAINWDLMRSVII